MLGGSSVSTPVDANELGEPSNVGGNSLSLGVTSFPLPRGSGRVLSLALALDDESREVRGKHHGPPWHPDRLERRFSGVAHLRRHPRTVADPEQARPGPGPARDEGAGLQQPCQQLRRLREQRCPLGLVQPIVACRPQQQCAICEAGKEQTHARQVEDGVRTRHLGVEGDSRLLGRQLSIGYEHDEHELGVKWQRERDRAGVEQRGRDEPAVHRSRRVLDVTLITDGHGERVVGAGSGRHRDGKSRGRAESAPDRDLGANRDREAVVAADRRGDAGSQVLPVPGEIGTLSLAVQDKSLRRDDLDVHVKGEGEGEDIEARTEVGRRRRGSGAHLGTAQPAVVEATVDPADPAEPAGPVDEDEVDEVEVEVEVEGDHPGGAGGR